MTNKLYEAMEKDSEVDIKGDDLSNISEMGRRLSNLEEEIEPQEEHLKKLKESHK